MSAVEALKEHGNQCFRGGRYLEAAAHFSEALAQPEGNPVLRSRLHSNRSAAYAALHRYEEALADGQAAVNLQSDWAKAYSRVATAYFALQQWDDASVAYMQVSWLSFFAALAGSDRSFLSDLIQITCKSVRRVAQGFCAVHRFRSVDLANAPKSQKQQGLAVPTNLPTNFALLPSIGPGAGSVQREHEGGPARVAATRQQEPAPPPVGPGAGRLAASRLSPHDGACRQRSKLCARGSGPPRPRGVLHDGADREVERGTGGPLPAAAGAAGGNGRLPVRWGFHGG